MQIIHFVLLFFVPLTYSWFFVSEIVISQIRMACIAIKHKCIKVNCLSQAFPREFLSRVFLILFLTFITVKNTLGIICLLIKSLVYCAWDYKLEQEMVRFLGSQVFYQKATYSYSALEDF